MPDTFQVYWHLNIFPPTWIAVKNIILKMCCKTLADFHFVLKTAKPWRVVRGILILFPVVSHIIRLVIPKILGIITTHLPLQLHYSLFFEGGDLKLKTKIQCFKKVLMDKNISFIMKISVFCFLWHFFTSPGSMMPLVSQDL